MTTSDRFRFAMGRPPAVAAEAMVSTSNPLATRAGLRILERGGTAADAAIAAAAVLCVTEPMNTGLGGDAFALVGAEGEVAGLDAAGPAPREPEPGPVARRGPRSVTVPGAVGGWAALSARFGRLGLDACLGDAIDLAERGTAVSARSAALWAAEEPCPAGVGPSAPRVGEVVAMPELAGTLRRVAESGPSAIYAGPVARAIATASWLTEEDLAGYEARWIAPLRAGYRGHEVIELPPPTQGVVVLEALALLDGLEPTLPNLIRCVQLALDDAAAHVRDRADVAHLLDPAFVAARRTQTPRPVRSLDGGTSHLCVVDGQRMSVSFIQSLFGSFGSGVVAGESGIVLHNRAACFALAGAVVAGARPYHTLIPGLLKGPDGRLGAFGVVGGHLQAQAHVQLVSALVDGGLDPQAALDAARFRVEGSAVLLEEGLWPAAAELAELGLDARPSTDWMRFGCGQAVIARGDALFGGSDPRMDGYAAGF